ncbi:MAG: 2-oxoglutarate dehydrogenase, E2 component, dihydrolipoamide succinyltransferase [Actinomycetia bacterium]|nr:2-oxoglutarate dehydrogenase, E2 component, dihydrolipoamide succinyltransferase [Actinomycetes bacterium]
MPVSVTLPQLGESVTEGTVTRWLKEIGDHVEADEPLLEVSTDKVDTEIPAPASGTLLSIAAAEDDIVEVGGVLAEIGDAQAATPASAEPEAPAPPAAAAAPAPEDPAREPSQPAPTAPTAAAPTTAAAAASPMPPATPGPQGAATGAATGTAVLLPELGESVTEGTVTRWLKAVGDEVAADEPLLEISTDKVDTEIPAPIAGTLLHISANEDDIVEVGGELARIGTGAAQTSPPADSTPPAPAPAEPSPPASAEANPAPTSREPSPAAPPPAPETPVTKAAPEPVPSSPPPAESQPADAGPAYVTPLVRKLASENGVDLSTVKGTGVGGRIRRQDVTAAAESAKAKPAAAPPAAAPTQPTPSAPGQLRGRTEKMSRLRRVIAQRMVESLQVSAQLTTVVEVDVTRIAQLRDRVKDSFQTREGLKLTFLPFFANAVVDALKTHPILNASVDIKQGTVTYHDAEHLGMAVDTERGLLVPVIRDAGDLNVTGFAKRIADLADRTRTNRVTPDELSGGTFTLTNTGSRGALFDTPIINQPQVAILGTGAVVQRPVVVAGPDGGSVIAVRSMVYLALTYDHRIVDGADAARFLGTVKQRLEDAEFEPELGG